MWEWISTTVKEHRHARGAQDRQPEFPLLDPVDPAEVAEFEQPDRCRNHYGRQRRIGKVMEQFWSGDDHQGDNQGPYNARHLGLGPGGFGNGRA